ncbi:hypothetical protein C9374_012913 [Naegleria lovaniensis]|uniref:Uncharacterized protein n=1 Tax=Naegleria lovaniensis TaxID=51637 RepID=A0AA88G7F2_NAELO|nr:uncharacterized protein C9374_012913 [Naegleria lovaniensis]KAG2373067.1 hypothetical protein C9374_012913 [Naegleria lovaniensis]
MLSDTEFVQGSNQYNFFFPVPTCAKLPYSGNVIPSWPNKLVLPRGENSKLVLCYEVDALLNWPLVHELAGNVLMRIINTHYKLSIPYQFNKVNTSKLGYFTTMKNLVDTGACDIAIASTNLDSNRLPQVHFNCPYGTSSPGYLRSALDLSNITISKPEDINNPNVTIVTYGGSFYATYAKNNFPLAKLIGLTSGYTECFTYILEKKAHIMLGDAIDLQTWVKQRSSECPGCESKAYDMSNAKIYDDKETVFVMIPFIDPSHMVDFTHLARAMIGMGIKSENIIILSADNKSHQQLPNVIPMKPYSPTLQKQDISITESVQSFTSDVPILSKLKVAFNYSIHNYPTFISALDEVFQNHETLFQFMQERNVQNRTKNLHLVIDIVFAAAYEWAHARQLNFTVFSNVPQIFAFEDFGNLIPRMLYETTSLERALRILKRQGLMAFIWNRLNEKVFKFVEFLTMAIPMVQKLDQYRVTSGMKALGVPFMDLSRYFVISLTLPGYAYTNVPLPPNVKLVGFTTSVKSNAKQTHSEDLTEWLEQHKKTNRKIVYMAFGTKASLSLEHARNVIQNILEFRNQSFDMVVSLKFSLQELFPNPNATYDSNRLIVRKWVNQEHVLKYASLFISWRCSFPF